jgi:hypothetical protein
LIFCSCSSCFSIRLARRFGYSAVVIIADLGRRDVVRLRDHKLISFPLARYSERMGIREGTTHSKEVSQGRMSNEIMLVSLHRYS